MTTTINIDYFNCLGDNVRKRRKEKGLSQEKLAELAECSRQTIGNIEHPNLETIPQFETLISIANALGCSIDNLTGHDAYSTHDIKGVCEFTGLSQDAVKFLHAAKEHTEKLNEYYRKASGKETGEFGGTSFEYITSKIIENGSLIDLIRNYHFYFQQADHIVNKHYRSFEDEIESKFDEDENADISLELELLEKRAKDCSVYSSSFRNGLKLSLAEEIVKIIDAIMPNEKEEFRKYIPSSFSDDDANAFLDFLFPDNDK